MKFIKKYKLLFIGVIIGILMSGTAVFAASGYTTIKVLFTPVKVFKNNTLQKNISAIKYGSTYYVPWNSIAPYLTENASFNGSQLKITSSVIPYNAKIVINSSEKSSTYNEGKTSYPAITLYKGILYTPVNYICSNLGILSNYESASKTLYIGQIPDGQYMSDMLEPYDVVGGSCKANELIKMGGKAYQKGYSIRHWSYSNKFESNFNIEGKYTKITGLVGLLDTNYGKEAVVNIVGDGKILKTFTIKKGDLPVTFDVDITGVVKLTFESTARQSYSLNIGFADVIIK